jgi:hypothetical protein
MDEGSAGDNSVTGETTRIGTKARRGTQPIIASVRKMVRQRTDPPGYSR